MNKAEASSPVSRLVIINDSSTPTFDATIKNYRLRKNSNFKTFFIGSGTRNPKNTEHVIYVDGCNEQVLRYGRIPRCLTFLFSLWDIFLRSMAGCSPGEALFLENLADGILSVC